MGRWAENVTMNQHDGRGDFEAAPVLIKAIDYMKGIRWSRLGTPEEAIAKTEMSRMLQVYQRFGAVQQPIRTITEKKITRVLWEIRFPPNSRWKNGPQRPSAYEAMLDNFVMNDKFPGYDGPCGQPDTVLRKLDAIIDDARKAENQKARSILLGEFK